MCYRNKNIHKLIAFLLIATLFNVSFTGAAIKADNPTGTENTAAYAGDVDGDGSINAKDVTLLRRYLAGGWGVVINTEDADVDGDGNVNAKDVTLLRRYLAGGWGVQLAQKETRPTVAPYVNQILSDDTLGVLVHRIIINQHKIPHLI